MLVREFHDSEKFLHVEQERRKQVAENSTSNRFEHVGQNKSIIDNNKLLITSLASCCHCSSRKFFYSR